MSDRNPPEHNHAGLARLLRAASTLHPDDLAKEVTRAVEDLGAFDVELLLVDLNQRHLRCLGDRESAHDVESTPAGEAFRTESTVMVDTDDGVRIFVPISDTMRLGILAVTADSRDERLLEQLAEIAALTGELVHTKNAYGDVIELTRRSADMSLAAEMRWSMLPPLSFVSASVAVSGNLEPAYDIAGDTFDYALNEDRLEFGIFDAVGHGLEASRMANLALASYRHSRRQKLDLASSVLALDELILSQFGDSRFVTAQLGKLDLRTGQLRVVSAGHPYPLLVRKDREAEELPCVPYLPAGLGVAGREPGEEMERDLEAGDCVLFYSDGVTEARSPERNFFGTERLGKRFSELIGAGLPIAEVTRTLVRDVLSHQQAPLGDDATLFLVRWRGPRG